MPKILFTKGAVNILEIIIYLLIFIIGTLFGSFFSLAVYRIPIKESIMHGRSYCTKCNHKLGFLDLIPVLSYICLGGKCRYCKEKIRGRYIYLELISGIVFLLFSLSLKVNIYEFQIEKIMYLVFGILFISSLFIIGGIEKENHNISNSVLLFGLIIETIYIIYLYVLKINIYRYVIYLFIMLILILINTIKLKLKGKESYPIQILILCSYISIFIREELVILSIIFTLLLVAIKQMILNINSRKEIIETKNDNISIGFYLCFINIFMIILQNYIF